MKKKKKNLGIGTVFPEGHKKQKPKRENKQTKNHWISGKRQNFWVSKDAQKKTTMQATDYEKIYVRHTPNKRHTSRR